MRTIGLFGGSFNPPHTGHQLVARYALESRALDELWVVPVFAHPRGKRLAPYGDRVAMCELATRALGPRVRVSRAERDAVACLARSTCRTIDLLEYLARTVAGARFRLVLGADVSCTASSWCRWPEVVARARPLVVGRGAYEIPAGFERVARTPPDISASAIRLRLAQCGTPRASEFSSLVPREVLRYIAARDLYATSAARSS